VRGSDDLWGISVDGRIILKYILEQQDVRTGLDLVGS
jgi:hypothetical protein